MTLRERGLDFEEARAVFEGDTLDFENMRQIYTERRFICVGISASEWSSLFGRRERRPDT